MQPKVDEHRWIMQVRLSLEEEEYEDEEGLPAVSIFSVPKTLTVCASDCYAPQQIAIGPYHHWRPELYEMERYKVASVKRFQRRLQDGLKFDNIVGQLIRFEPSVRACYHKYLNFNSETLAWMMAMDACFLLQFLHVYAAAKDGNKVLDRLSSRMSSLVDVAGRKSAHNAVVRDIVMLENQMPMFLLRKMLEYEFCSLEVAHEVLVSMLFGFSKEILPFKMMQDESPKVDQAKEHAHLLDFLYDMIVPKLEVPSHHDIIEIIDHEGERDEGNQENQQYFKKSESSVNKAGVLLWNMLKKLNVKAPVDLIKRILFSKPVKLVLKLPWKIISNLPILKALKEPIEHLFLNSVNKDQKEESENLSDKPPLAEEIAIPSVTKLSEAGVNFVASSNSGGIMGISFDRKTATFYLPRISLDVNSEVILRNLVAYETCNASGPLVFTRYTELMNGIIDSEEDAKFLREKGIIQNRLKNDGEVAKMWNGMSKSVKLTKVPFLDKAIEDVNKYYSGRWKTRIGTFFKNYVFGSWRLLTLIAAILLLVMTMLQSFCSVYSCPRVFHIEEEALS